MSFFPQHPFAAALLIWLVLANLLALLLYGLDKRKAKKGAWRIPERTLFLLAALGGSPGAICGMLLFRHKTLKTRFRIGLPLILLAQLALAFWLLIRFAR